MKNILKKAVHIFNIIYDAVKYTICTLVYVATLAYKALIKLCKFALMLSFLALVIGFAFFTDPTIAFLANLWTKLKGLIISLIVIAFIILIIFVPKDDEKVKIVIEPNKNDDVKQIR